MLAELSYTVYKVTMNKILSPDQHIIQLHMQPDFPMVDLTEDNTEMLKYILGHAAGLEAYTRDLADKQRFIHQIANRAARLLGLHTQYDPAELYAFSNGFAGFETISDLVHPARVYDLASANAQVAKFLVDTRDIFDIEVESQIFAPAEKGEDEVEVIHTGDGEAYGGLRVS